MGDMTVNNVGDGYESSHSTSYDSDGDANNTADFGQDGTQGFGIDPNNVNPDQALQDFQQQSSNPLGQGTTPGNEGIDPTGQGQCNGGQTTPDAAGAGNANGGESPEDMAAKMLAQAMGISEEEAKQMLSGKEEGIPATENPNATFA
jgi:hypothetical protein